MDSQGTLSIDILFATFILLIIIGLTSTLILDRFNMADNSKELAEARCLAENIAGSINQVYAGGDGHKIRIHIPNNLNKDCNFKVMINSTGVLVRLDGRRGLAYIIPNKISNKINVLNSSTITLYPDKNYIIVNKKQDKGDNWIVILEE